MSIRTQQLKKDAKQADTAARVEFHEGRADDKGGEEHRRAAAHAHVMTHHALELDTPEAHEAAAAAHSRVADMHMDCAEDLNTMDVGPGQNKSAKGSPMTKSKATK